MPKSLRPELENEPSLTCSFGYQLNFFSFLRSNVDTTLLKYNK